MIGGQLSDKNVLSIILKSLSIEYIDVSSFVLCSNVGNIAQTVNDLHVHESLLAIRTGASKCY